MRLFKIMMAGLATSLLATGTARAVERPVAASAIEPTHMLVTYYFEEWSNNVREASNGEIDFEVFAGGSLVSAAGMIEAVNSGLAQVGQVALTYSPSVFPVATVLADMGFVQPDPFVLMFAFADFTVHEEIGRGVTPDNSSI